MSDSALTGTTLIKVMKEMKQLLAQPPEGIQVHFSDDNVSTIFFDLTGPIDTPFEGGFFRCKLQLPGDYPQSAPKGWFLTKIFHPNMNFKTGEICVSTLKKDWHKSLGLKHVLVSIRCLLIEPNPESALNEEAGKLLLENYADYFQRAKMMTKVHAKPSAALPSSSSSDASIESNPPSASPSPTPDSASVSKDATLIMGNSPAPSPMPTPIGEEENSNTTNVASALLNSSAPAAVKKPLAISANATNSSAIPAAAAGAAVKNVSAAAAAAEAKAKALKKKSLKRL